MNGNGYQPIRRYKENKTSSSRRYLGFAVFIIVIMIATAVLVMSLTGTGLFGGPRVIREMVYITQTDPPETTEPVVTETEGETTEAISYYVEDDSPIEYTYVEVSADNMHEGTLLVLNAEHPYAFPVSELQMLVRVIDQRDGSYGLHKASALLQKRVILSMNDMFNKFREETGLGTCLIYEAYRTMEDQQRLFRNNPLNAAVPGCSDYHLGTTFMVKVTADDGLIWDYSLSKFTQLAWLQGHCAEYGFIFRYPSGKQDITGYDIDGQMRYVGVSHASYMLEKDYCLEEYLEYLRNNTSYDGNHVTVNAGDGYQYEMFYEPLPAEGVLRLPVPSNRPYDISGDNLYGFVVSMKVGKLVASK